MFWIQTFKFPFRGILWIYHPPGFQWQVKVYVGIPEPKKLNKKSTPSKFNSKNPWKMMGKDDDRLSFWYGIYFQGQAVKLPRGTLLFPELLLIFGLIRPQGSNTQCNPKEWDPHGRGQKWIWCFFSYIFLMEILNLALHDIYISKT